MQQSTKNIAILMATYNGEKYLREQLQSLYNQTYTDWTLYIGDDGSSDGTASIVREFSQRYGNIVFHQNSEGKGAMRNFMDLLAEAEADYYMFCDQDDVWLPHKVETTLRKMRETEAENKERPALACSDLRVVDKNLHTIAPSFWQMSEMLPELLTTNFNYLGVHFLATGCTMMINAAAKRIAFPYPPCAFMHDAWLVMKTMKSGGAFGIISEPLMLYRQHESNVLGAGDIDHSSLRYKLSNFKVLQQQNKKMYALARYFGYGSWLKFIFYKVMYKWQLRKARRTGKQ